MEERKKRNANRDRMVLVLCMGYLLSHFIDGVHIVESFCESVAHDVHTTLREVHIVGTAKSFFYPSRHGVESAHSIVDAPIGGTVSTCGVAQRGDDLG